MKDSFEKLKKAAARIAELDERVIEIFVHSDTPKDPLQNEEVDLVCHLADPNITQDLDAYNDEGFAWGLDMAEKIRSDLEELGINTEVIISPFNFQMHDSGEYGEYYYSLFLKPGFDPVLEVADQQKKNREEHMIGDLEQE
ncbi:MAG: hypothetical protein U5L00_09985 [Desulfovermiculus sp.]|nr:hypothetical protein [Desulfovermiculus sp.]